MRIRPGRWFWLLLLLVLVTSTVAYCYARPHTFGQAFWQHAHCMKQTAILFRSYAEQNGGRYPFHPAGYPQAILLFPNDSPWYTLTGPGYEVEDLANAKRNGEPLREEQCGRVYVQGLTIKSNPEIVILFDKVPTPGGDHCHFPRRLWASYARDVLYADCRNGIVPESEWPEFARKQVGLLIKEGIARAEAERLYGL